ncbi:MAG: hypothetical protein HY318_16485, partial [Armatimonadetes bacterium]|nr:hypothetical protein [Armatimonadota bacterium]
MRVAWICLVTLTAGSVGWAAAGLDSMGNTDGVLTWRLGDLTPGQSAREVVLLVFDDSAEKAAKRVESARRQFAELDQPRPESASLVEAPKVWIKNEATDFALEGPCFFRWRMERQSLACKHGGQLSQFTYYLHYRDSEGTHRAGVPQDGDSSPENLRLVEPVHAVSDREATGVVETTDGKLRMRARAVMGQGSVVGVEFVVTNRNHEPVTDLHLTAYANIEADNTHDGDFSFLDAKTGGLVVYDPPTEMCVVMAGLHRPVTGYSGTWNSFPKLQAGDGIAVEQWKTFDGVPPELAKQIGRESSNARGYYLPFIHEDPQTPETRTLSAAEARAALERDWLFQAMGRPLAERASQEIGWTRRLAARLARAVRPPKVTSNLAELEALEKRLRGLAGKRTAPSASGAVPASPSWIWFPEGQPAEAVPAEGRFFRCTFDVPAVGVRAAELRIAVDDACEVYLNGARLGTHETWKQAASFPVEKLLKSGRNVLSVRAENRSGPAQNPAGLIAFLPMTLADGKQRAVVSDTSWRSAKDAPPEWSQPAFDDSTWKAAAVAAPLGKGPWGNIAGLDGGDLGSAFADMDPAVRDTYFAVRRIKRRLMFKNALLDFTQLLFIDQPYPQGPVNDTHQSIHRMGITATPGGRMLLLDGLSPGGTVRLLAPDRKPGSFWRPDLSFDGRRVLFCYKAHDSKSFHLYEMNLDGANSQSSTGLRQLTNSDYDDIDPIYLP